jgi:YjjG family noncanonical pyrimidine nucleotidase
MDYPILLFDIDNTLLDTHANEKNALIKLCAQRQFPLTAAGIDYYHALNERLWNQFERQEITRQTLLDHRFQLFFAHFGVAVDGPATQDQFGTFFHREFQLVPHAEALLKQLASHHQLCIISNGTKAKQTAQMHGANLDHYFEHVFLSEDLGYRKPDPRFFDDIRQTLPNATDRQMLVIGDSLTADIAGANQSHLDSVWFNPTQLPNQTAYVPTYEIQDLLEITTLLQ